MFRTRYTGHATRSRATIVAIFAIGVSLETYRYSEVLFQLFVLAKQVFGKRVCRYAVGKLTLLPKHTVPPIRPGDGAKYFVIFAAASVGVMLAMRDTPRVIWH